MKYFRFLEFFFVNYLQEKYNFAKAATIYLMMLSLRDLLFHVPVYIGVRVTLKSDLYLFLNSIHI